MDRVTTHNRPGEAFIGMRPAHAYTDLTPARHLTLVTALHGPVRVAARTVIVPPRCRRDMPGRARVLAPEKTGEQK